MVSDVSEVFTRSRLTQTLGGSGGFETESREEVVAMETRVTVAWRPIGTVSPTLAVRPGLCEVEASCEAQPPTAERSTVSSKTGMSLFTRNHLTDCV
jgi:hypothetical protein